MTSELVLLIDDEPPIFQLVRMHRIIFDLLDLADLDAGTLVCSVFW